MPLDVSQEVLARETEAATSRLLLWRAELRAGTDIRAPYTDSRRIASRATLQALESELPSALLRGLFAHVRYHLATRLALELEQELGEEILRASRSLNLEVRTEVSFRAALGGLLATRDPERARAYYSALIAENDTALSLQARRRELMAEACNQLGIQVADIAAPPGEYADRLQACEQFLVATHDLARDVGERAQAKLNVGGHDAFIACIIHANPTAAALTFPAKLSARWLHDAVPNLTFKRVDPGGGNERARALLGRPPEPLAATSFARMLGKLGAAVRWTLPESPHEAIARGDAGGFDPATFEQTFAALVLSPVFLTRALHASGSALDSARDFAPAALLHARITAARALCTHTRASEDLVLQVFGASMDRKLGMLLLAGDEHAALRAAALFAAVPLTERLHDVFDEDWFRNPRAREFLSGAGATAELAPPSYTTAADKLRARLEELAS